MGVDIIILQGDIVRMNTVFKFYLHVWVLFALASAFLVWQLVFVYWRPLLARPKHAIDAPASSRRARRDGLVCAAVLRRRALPDLRHAGAPGRPLRRLRQHRPERRGLRAKRDLQRRARPDSAIEGLRGHRVDAPERAGLPDHRRRPRRPLSLGRPLLDLHRPADRRGLGLAPAAAARRPRLHGDSSAAPRWTTSTTLPITARLCVSSTSTTYATSSSARSSATTTTPAGLAKFATGFDGALQPVFENDMLTIYEVEPSVIARALTR